MTVLIGKIFIYIQCLKNVVLFHAKSSKYVFDRIFMIIIFVSSLYLILVQIGPLAMLDSIKFMLLLVSLINLIVDGDPMKTHNL